MASTNTSKLAEDLAELPYLANAKRVVASATGLAQLNWETRQAVFLALFAELPGGKTAEALSGLVHKRRQGRKAERALEKSGRVEDLGLLPEYCRREEDAFREAFMTGVVEEMQRQQAPRGLCNVRLLLKDRALCLQAIDYLLARHKSRVRTRTSLEHRLTGQCPRATSSTTTTPVQPRRSPSSLLAGLPTPGSATAYLSSAHKTPSSLLRPPRASVSATKGSSSFLSRGMGRLHLEEEEEEEEEEQRPAWVGSLKTQEDKDAADSDASFSSSSLSSDDEESLEVPRRPVPTQHRRRASEEGEEEEPSQAPRRIIQSKPSKRLPVSASKTKATPVRDPSPPKPREWRPAAAAAPKPTPPAAPAAVVLPPPRKPTTHKNKTLSSMPVRVPLYPSPLPPSPTGDEGLDMEQLREQNAALRQALKEQAALHEAMLATGGGVGEEDERPVDERCLRLLQYQNLQLQRQVQQLKDVLQGQQEASDGFTGLVDMLEQRVEEVVGRLRMPGGGGGGSGGKDTPESGRRRSSSSSPAAAALKGVGMETWQALVQDCKQLRAKWRAVRREARVLRASQRLFLPADAVVCLKKPGQGRYASQEQEVGGGGEGATPLLSGEWEDRVRLYGLTEEAEVDGDKLRVLQEDLRALLIGLEKLLLQGEGGQEEAALDQTRALVLAAAHLGVALPATGASSSSSSSLPVRPQTREKELLQGFESLLVPRLKPTELQRRVAALQDKVLGERRGLLRGVHSAMEEVCRFRVDPSQDGGLEEEEEEEEVVPEPPKGRRRGGGKELWVA